MTAEFLLEIGTEEIPAGFVGPALQSLTGLVTTALDNSRIARGSIETFATPRRLVLLARDVAELQESRVVEKTGPPVQQAYDEQGNPTKAAVGFARSQGVDVSELIVVQGPKGDQIAVRKTEVGQPASAVLAEVLPGLFEKVTFPKTMRWMDQEVRFARPVHWIVALLGGKVVQFSFGNIESGATSFGHRFAHPGGFAVTSFAGLRGALEAQGVVLDPELRRGRIERLIKELAASVDLHIYEDSDLLDEVNFLVESPYPVMGTFSPEFLELPASILITCMKKHQRYFSVQDDNGRITNRFIAVNNTPVRDPAVSVKGHQRVLKARLEDARFYFREDRREPLFSRLEALKGVVFHSKLGTAFEKVERFTNLARKLAEKLAPNKIAQVERAAKLCKCDLETGIVYEFPELQGVIGRYYAKMDGESEEVATAVEQHYWPTHAGGRLPEGIVGAIVSIADRIDTIAGCFSVGLIPTGAADPYALRRHALGIIQIVINLEKPLDLDWLVREAVRQIGNKRTRPGDQAHSEVMEFIRTRFVNFHTSRDFPLDVVEAAVRARFDDLLDARQRVEALSQWKQRDDFDAIMIGFKRVVNILRDTTPAKVSEALFAEDSERKLFDTFVGVRDRVEPLFESGDYARALEVIAELKAPIDDFFFRVLVMAEEEHLRNNRLGLLREIASIFERVADFSFIGSTAK